MKFAFIEKHRGEFEVGALCRVLAVSRSGFYSWRKRLPSKRSVEDERLKSKILELHQKSRRTYGSPRILDDLKEEGERTSRKRVARIMRESGIFSKHKRKFRVTTDSEHRFPVAENHLNREFKAEAPDRKWVTDITHIPTKEGWMYLAVVLDLFSRRVVGWSMSRRLDASLVSKALSMAFGQRMPSAGMLHHSDRGAQYASNEYRELLTKNDVLASMSRKGNCWDNAVAESFFKTLKIESSDLRIYKTRDEAQSSIFDYIEVFYNRRRKHSTLGFRSPVDFERLHVATCV